MTDRWLPGVPAAPNGARRGRRRLSPPPDHAPNMHEKPHTFLTQFTLFFLQFFLYSSVPMVHHHSALVTL